MAKTQTNGRHLSRTIKAAEGKTTVSKRATAPGQTEFSGDQIGNVAGVVWHTLSEKGGMSLASLKKSVDAPADVVTAAVGWLAREGKLEFSTSGRSVQVSLK